MQARCAVTVAAGVVLFAMSGSVADDVARDETRSARGNRSASNDGWRPAKKVETEESRAETRRVLAIGDVESPVAAFDFQAFSVARPTALNPRPSTYLAAAQSPEDDRYGRGGPSWTYPVRRAPATAPVPDYRGESDFASRSSQYDTRLAQAPRRDEWSVPARDDFGTGAARRFPGAPRPQSVSWSAPQQPTARAGYQEPYHSSPFENAGPSCPTDPYAPNPYAPAGPCAPCQPPPPVAFGDPCDPSNFYRCRYTWNAGYLFGVVEGFRFDGDDTRIGGRLGTNWGLPLIDDDSGWGIQAGYSAGVAEGGGQLFATGGIFFRGDMRYGSAFNAGAAVDFLQDNAYDTDVWQIRPKASVTLDARNEIGVWGAVNFADDEKRNGQTIESVDQANMFYRFLLPGGADLAPFVGWRREPGEFALGGNYYVPLGDFWALVGGGFYAFESDSWNAFAGLVLHWGPRARQDFIGQDRHLPYLPVADNTSMTLFLDR